MRRRLLWGRSRDAGRLVRAGGGGGDAPGFRFPAGKRHQGRGPHCPVVGPEPCDLVFRKAGAPGGGAGEGGVRGVSWVPTTMAWRPRRPPPPANPSGCVSPPTAHPPPAQAPGCCLRVLTHELDHVPPDTHAVLGESRTLHRTLVVFSVPALGSIWGRGGQTGGPL